MKKTLCFILSLFLAFSAVACGKKESKSIRLDMEELVTNLDPQFATSNYAKVILSNTMEGLVRQDETGSMIPAVAENFTISSDGTIYTFHLRKDAVWTAADGSKETEKVPVTAHDFVFAFQRMFNPQVPSPYSGEYLMIKGASQALAGEISPGEVGVKAVDDHTLQIMLTEPSPFFIQRLAATPALPCNEAFFNETRARYGLSQKYLMSNGPFMVSRWDNEKYILMEKNEGYYGAQDISCPSVYFYCSRLTDDDGNTITTPRELFLEQKADIARVEYSDIEALAKKGYFHEAFDDKVWVLLPNQNSTVLANENIRKAVCGVLEREELVNRAPERYDASDSLVPPDTHIFDKTYQELRGKASVLVLEEQQARELVNTGCAELGIGKMPTLSLILPQSAELSSLGGYFQKLWQQKLGIYVNMEVLPDNDFQKAIRSSTGWDLAFYPVEVKGEGPSSTLSSFLSTSSDNISGYSNEEYDQLLKQVQTALQVSDVVTMYKNAEEILMQSGAAVPLYVQSTYYATGKDVSGVDLFAGGGMSFRNARRD